MLCYAMLCYAIQEFTSRVAALTGVPAENSEYLQARGSARRERERESPAEGGSLHSSHPYRGQSLRS